MAVSRAARPDELIAILRARAGETIDAARLEQKLRSSRKLRVKLGIDPTSPHLHIGHMLPLWFLRAFQDAGHRAVLIIGDFTARIGDPSGRSAARTALSTAQVKKNERTYLAQIGRVLDLKRAEVRHNSEWLGTMRLEQFLGLLARFPLKSAWEREDFQKRLAAGKPVQLSEAMYPVLQAYDSVAVKADVELGGMDQRLNVLAGRELQAAFGKEPQDVVLLPYLVGLDGSQKMSKSLGNTIDLLDAADVMFGKVMRIPDALIPSYAALAAWLPAADVDRIVAGLQRGENPRDAKLEVAEGLVRRFYGDAAARAARAAFVRLFSARDQSGEFPESALGPGRYAALDIIARLGGTSKSEARRLLAGKALEINQRPVLGADTTVELESGDVIRIGKKKFFRVP
ncbi:tyrosine--tRNA ligase [Candidatus Parcubacteria bacterium]|nr:MAG: tyrosine--tRNA ligase [Candidatus Parcubacteria bacterium]